MRSHQARATALLGVALLLAATIAACGRNGSTAPVAGTPRATATIPAATSDAPMDQASVVNPAGTPAGGPTAIPTPDPVASQLDQLDQLINDLQNSLKDSDSSQQGGE